MPMINLIQEQRLAAAQNDKRSRALFMSFVASAMLGLAATGFLFLQAESKQSEVANLTRRVDKLEPVLEKISANEKVLNIMAPKLATLSDAKDLNQRWSKILDFLTRNTPEGLWLTALRCSQTDPNDPVQLTVQGLSLSQDAVGDLLLRLKSSEDLFERADLKFTQEENVETGRIKFELIGHVTGTGAPKPKAKKDDKEDAA